MDIVSTLRKQAIEVAEEDIPGWGNTMTVAADEIERLRAEIADLRDACAEKQRCIDSSVEAQRAFLAEIDALRAELAKAKRDAERYRWLRVRLEVKNQMSAAGDVRPALTTRVGCSYFDCSTPGDAPIRLARLEAAIDAAMAGGE